MHQEDRAKKAVAITASDTVAIPAGPTTYGISVATAGAYTVLLEGDTVPVAMNLAAGVIHRLAVKRVNAGGAASVNGIVGFYLQ